jgi:hypothetical protein
LKEIINREHKKEEDGKDLNNSRAMKKRYEWINKLPENKNIKGF